MLGSPPAFRNRRENKRKVRRFPSARLNAQLEAARSAHCAVVDGDPAVAGRISARRDASTRLTREACDGARQVDAFSVLVREAADRARPYSVGLNERVLSVEDAYVAATGAGRDPFLGPFSITFARPFRAAARGGTSRGGRCPRPFRSAARLRAVGWCRRARSLGSALLACRGGPSRSGAGRRRAATRAQGGCGSRSVASPRRGCRRSFRSAGGGR